MISIIEKLNNRAQNIEVLDSGITDFFGTTAWVKEIRKNNETIGWLHTGDYDDEGNITDDATWKFTRKREIEINVGTLDTMYFSSEKEFLRALVIALDGRGFVDILLSHKVHCVQAPVIYGFTNVRMFALGQDPSEPNADVFIKCIMEVLEGTTSHKTVKTTKKVFIDPISKCIFLENGQEFDAANKEEALKSLAVSVANC